MKKRNYKNQLFLTIILMITMAVPVFAEENIENLETGVRYSRISEVYGDVFLEQSMAAESLAVRQNLPVLTGDRLTSNRDGSAEIIVDDGSVIWIWNDTKLDMDQLEFAEDGQAQLTRLKLWFGVLAARFHDPANDASERVIEIGPGEIYIRNNAMFFVESLGKDQACLAVTSGQVTLSHQGVYRIVKSGESVCIDADSDLWVDRQYYPDTSFQEWVSTRDRALGNMSYTDNTPEEYQNAGADFEDHGRWIFYNSIWCWSPYVSASWVPYHHGVWVWITGWGWTWVPDEPWGWYPYHYGCWSYAYGYGWMWSPYWEWRTHYAAWRWHGRSVHWVAMHPDDHRDRHGQLLIGTVPKNSLVKLGIPVEAGQTIDELLARNPVQGGISSHKMPSTVSWHNNPPLSLSPGKSGKVRSYTDISPSYTQPRTTQKKGRVPNPTQPYQNIRKPAPVQQRWQRPAVQSDPYPVVNPNLMRKSSKAPVQNQKPRVNSPKKPAKESAKVKDKKQKKRSPTEVWKKKDASSSKVKNSGKSNNFDLSGTNKKNGNNSQKVK